MTEQQQSTALTERAPTMAPVSVEEQAEVLEQVVIHGDLARLTPPQRVAYYRQVCSTLGLNPFTRPFQYISLNGRLTLYPSRDATDQLRRNNRIDVTGLERATDTESGIHSVVATGRDRHGRQDSALGAVYIKGLQGEALANALMKAETKAKRRLTLSLAGLGMFDETEIDSIEDAVTVRVDDAGNITEVLPGEGRPITALLADRLGALRQQREEEPLRTGRDGQGTVVEPGGGDSTADTAAAAPAPSADASVAAQAEAEPAAQPVAPATTVTLPRGSVVPLVDPLTNAPRVVQAEAVLHVSEAPGPKDGPVEVVQAEVVPGQVAMFDGSAAPVVAKPARRRAPAAKPAEAVAEQAPAQTGVGEQTMAEAGSVVAAGTWAGAILNEVADDQEGDSLGLRLKLELDSGGQAQVAFHGDALEAYYALNDAAVVVGQRLQVSGRMVLVPWQREGHDMPPYRRILANMAEVAP